MDLYVMRHGKAEDRGTIPGDYSRNLTVVGRDEVRKIAGSLRDMRLHLDYIATSPLNRALQTAEILSKRLRVKGDLRKWDELKPEGDPGAVYRRLSELPLESSVLIVGHEPSLSNLILDATGHTREARAGLVMKKAGLAKISVYSTNPRRFSGSLVWLLTPKLLKRLG